MVGLPVARSELQGRRFGQRFVSLSLDFPGLTLRKTSWVWRNQSNDFIDHRIQANPIEWLDILDSIAGSRMKSTSPKNWSQSNTIERLSF